MRKYPARRRAIASALRDARKEAGISQRKLSKQLGQTFTFMFMVEAGERGILAEEFIEIAIALGIDPKELRARVLRRK